MRYKRGEAFRYEFGEPLPVSFTIDKLNGSAVKTSDGKAELLDLSLKGLKIVTPLSIPFENDQEVKVTIHFPLNIHSYSIQGKLVWKKQRLSDYYYGIQYTASESVQEGILEDLKTIGKRMA